MNPCILSEPERLIDPLQVVWSGLDLPAELFQRTVFPLLSAMFVRWDVRAAWCPTRTCAFGVFRLRMQSSQFCRWVSVPSPLDRTKISGSGVSVPAA